MSTLVVTDIPSISIFVRHSRDCRYRGDESYRGCRCSKHLRWRIDGRQVRQSARTRLWRVAEERRRQLEAKFATDAESAAAIKIESKERTTIRRAVELFITDKKSEGMSAGVVGKYDRELGRFEEFLTRRGKFLPHEITAEDLTEYRAGWHRLYESSQTRGKVQERLKAFLKYCYNARLIDRVPTLKSIKIDAAPTLPLTEKEYQKLLDTIPASFPDVITIPGSGKVKAYTRAAAVKNRAGRIRALVQLMRWSGLAITDAVTLERSELFRDEGKGLWRVVTSRQKTGTHVSVPLPEDVAAELLAVKNENKRYVFWSGSGTARTAVSHWQDDFRKLFRDAGLYDGAAGNMVSHRLRDTFAVHLLEKGVPIEEVSRALGHESIKTTEKHYAKWVKSRQDRMDSLVSATWKDATSD